MANTKTLTEDDVPPPAQEARSNTFAEPPEGNPIVRRRRHRD